MSVEGAAVMVKVGVDMVMMGVGVLGVLASRGVVVMVAMKLGGLRKVRSTRGGSHLNIRDTVLGFRHHLSELPVWPSAMSSMLLYSPGGMLLRGDGTNGTTSVDLQVKILVVREKKGS